MLQSKINVTLRSISLGDDLSSKITDFTQRSIKYMENPTPQNQSHACKLFIPTLRDLKKKGNDVSREELDGLSMMGELVLNIGYDVGCVRPICPKNTVCSPNYFGIHPQSRCVCDRSFLTQNDQFSAQIIRKGFT